MYGVYLFGRVFVNGCDWRYYLGGFFCYGVEWFGGGILGVGGCGRGCGLLFYCGGCGVLFFCVVGGGGLCLMG